MGLVKKSISVTEQQDAWIKAQLETGRFATDSEVIRSAIALKQTELQEIEFLKERLKEARASGLAPVQSGEELLAEFKAEMRRGG